MSRENEYIIKLDGILEQDIVEAKEISNAIRALDWEENEICYQDSTNRSSDDYWDDPEVVAQLEVLSLKRKIFERRLMDIFIADIQYAIDDIRVMEEV